MTNREIQAMLGIMRRTSAPVLVALLSGAAIVLFALAATSSHAVTASQTQSIQATVESQVTWGSANGCVQNIQTNDFGTLVPNFTNSTLGVFDATPEAEASTDANRAKVWVGCITANTTLASVAAQGTENMRSGSNTIPLSDVNIGLTNANEEGQVHEGTAGCTVTAGQSSAGSCSLPKEGSSRTLVSNASEGTTELDWQYQLNLPANQPVGSYTGGQVTFTATV